MPGLGEANRSREGGWRLSVSGDGIAAGDLECAVIAWNLPPILLGRAKLLLGDAPDPRKIDCTMDASARVAPNRQSAGVRERSTA
jgi:hypothetical protein